MHFIEEKLSVCRSSVHLSHPFWQFFSGHKSFKEECHRIVISGVQIGLNEANLINDVHLITSLWRLVLNERTQLSRSETENWVSHLKVSQLKSSSLNSFVCWLNLFIETAPGASTLHILHVSFVQHKFQVLKFLLMSRWVESGDWKKETWKMERVWESLIYMHQIGYQNWQCNHEFSFN